MQFQRSSALSRTGRRSGPPALGVMIGLLLLANESGAATIRFELSGTVTGATRGFPTLGVDAGVPISGYFEFDSTTPAEEPGGGLRNFFDFPIVDAALEVGDYSLVSRPNCCDHISVTTHDYWVHFGLQDDPDILSFDAFDFSVLAAEGQSLFPNNLLPLEPPDLSLAANGVARGRIFGGAHDHDVFGTRASIHFEIDRLVLVDSGANIPEPGTAVLFGLGLAGLGAWRRPRGPPVWESGVGGQGP